jgi:hypothetical protein
MNGIENLGQLVEQPLVPQQGVHNIRKAADMLADFGRNGDTYLIHAAEGETVLPMEVLESNPRLKKMLFKQIEELGLDPERYIVGNKLNSINPVTGKPEFFFGKIFKTVKRVFKPVVRVLKAVAPIALPIIAPIALPFLPLPLSVGLGSMAGGLISGQSAGDAFKSGLISGGLAGLGNVAFGSPEGFGAGSFFGSRTDPTRTLFGSGGYLGSGTGPATNNPFSGALSASAAPTPTPSVPSTSPGSLISQAQSGLPGGSASGFVGGGDPLGTTFRASTTPAINLPQTPVSLSSASPYLPGVVTPTSSTNYAQIAANQSANVVPNVVPTGGIPQQITPPSGGGGILDSLKGGVDKTKSFVGGVYDDYLSPTRTSIQPSAADIGSAYQTKLGEYAAQGITLGPAEQKALYDTTQASMQPSFFRKYGPIAGVGLGGVMALDALNKPEEEGSMTMAELQEQTGPTGTELYQQDPTRYGFDQGFYGRNPYYQAIRYTPPYVQAKEGGEIVGPGTATSDSVPALLSDGEFVMTAGAVRGAGGGNRADGARKMYDMMKQFEQRVTAA